MLLYILCFSYPWFDDEVRRRAIKTTRETSPGGFPLPSRACLENSPTSGVKIARTRRELVEKWNLGLGGWLVQEFEPIEEFVFTSCQIPPQRTVKKSRIRFSWTMISVLEAAYRHGYFAGRWDQLQNRPVWLTQRQQQQHTRGENDHMCFFPVSGNQWRLWHAPSPSSKCRERSHG